MKCKILYSRKALAWLGANFPTNNQWDKYAYQHTNAKVRKRLVKVPRGKPHTSQLSSG
jgi:hypothetical protein